MKTKNILKNIKGKTITQVIKNLQELEALGYGNEKINIKSKVDFFYGYKCFTVNTKIFIKELV